MQVTVVLMELEHRTLWVLAEAARVCCRFAILRCASGEKPLE
jgi:hypothetical protein